MTRNTCSSEALGATSTDIPTQRYQIVFVTGESAPWSRTGGLGDTMESLPISLAEMGHRVCVVSPRWDQYEDGWDTGTLVNVPFGDTKTSVKYFHTFNKNVDRVFVDHSLFLETVKGDTGRRLYGPHWGSDYADNQFKFSLFCKAAIEAIKHVGFAGYPYGENCVIICNDWHSALVPMYIDAERKEKELWKNTKVCLLVHNMQFQGRFTSEPWHMIAYNLPQSYINSMKMMIPLGGVDAPPVEILNWLKGGMLHSDKLFTVSPSYAKECMSSSSQSGCLSDIIQQKGGIVGILNGMKETVRPYNVDILVPSNMLCSVDMSTIWKKAHVKQQVQMRFGFVRDTGIPLMMYLGHLEDYKGTDILLDTLRRFVFPNHQIQFLIVGEGRDEYVNRAKQLEKDFPTKCITALNFINFDKYCLFGAADWIVLPSRIEPCGRVQMECMRFGTLPIAAPTGGLKDTVMHRETGIMMKKRMPIDTCEKSVAEGSEVVYDSIKEAIEMQQNEVIFESMRKAAMNRSKRFNYRSSANDYLKAFNDLGVVDIGSTEVSQKHVEVLS